MSRYTQELSPSRWIARFALARRKMHCGLCRATPPVCQRCVHTVLMPVQHSYEVTNAERVRGGILMTFADGKCALFPPELLYSLLPQAQEIPEATLEEES
jgi:hypothetical protein